MPSILIQRVLLRRSCQIVTRKPLLQLYKEYSQPRVILNMNEALLYYEKGNETFDFSFRYIYPDLNVDRQFNFSRQVKDPVNAFLRRIDIAINRFITMKKKRKSKKKNEETEETPHEDNVENNNIKLLRDDSKIDGETLCLSVLEDPVKLKLVIFDATYYIKVNMPRVLNMSLPKTILAGFPVHATKFESVYTDMAKSEFIWYKKDLIGNKPKRTWTQVGEGYLFVPDVCDIGSVLKLHCIPRNESDSGPATEVESTNLVEAGPGPCPFESRHAFTKDRLSGKSFRVVSYNILADVYTDSDYSKEVLFPYCPTYALDMNYRKQLILKELIGFNSDIICLQEVDSKFYKQGLLMSLSTLGYEGVFNTKNETPEGLAMFFNKERFALVDSVSTVLSQNIDLNRFCDVWSKIENEKAKERFLKRNTTLQVTTLRSKDNPSEILLVGNVHLYFHPDADHIRLLQAYYVVTYIEELCKKIQKENPECNTNIVLCGDFNSVPECGIYQLITENCVPENCDDWSSNKDEAIQNVSLTHDLHLSSACGTPEYTNYTPQFSGCLDYIFYQTDRLNVEQVIPMPSKEELTVHSGLPSVVFPSDHISLCADLKWTK